MIYIHLAQGFEEIEALAVVNILRRAGLEALTVSVMPERTVEGARGIPVVADIMFDNADYDSCEMIVLPGGMPGSEQLYRHEGLRRQLARFQAEDKWIAAICAAPGVVLGQLGLLKGKTAVCYPGYEAMLEGADIGEGAVAVSGKLITSKGPGTVFLFALQIAELLQSPRAVSDVKADMLLDSDCV